MQPYMNQNYFGQYNPTLMNQQQRLMQMEQQYPQFSQQPMQFQQPIGLSGRVIDDISSVNANEVPMNGDFGIFPKKDMSEVYLKCWSQDGTIRTTLFKPVLEDKVDKTTLDLENSATGAIQREIEGIKEVINGISDKIDQLQKTVSPKTAQKKKESDG